MVVTPPASNFKTNPFRYDPSGQEQLEALGLGLWLGEGTKGPKKVEVTNCDPHILKTWVAFLIRVCGIDPQHLVLRINLHDPKCGAVASAYWDQQLGISLRKTIRQKRVVDNPKKSQLMGTVSICFNSKFLRSHIETRARALVEDLM